MTDRFLKQILDAAHARVSIVPRSNLEAARALVNEAVSRDLIARAEALEMAIRNNAMAAGIPPGGDDEKAVAVCRYVARECRAYFDQRRRR